MAPQQGWLKALRTPRGLSFACLALGFISLVWVLLVGVGSLTSACNSGRGGGWQVGQQRGWAAGAIYMCIYIYRSAAPLGRSKGGEWWRSHQPAVPGGTALQRMSCRKPSAPPCSLPQASGSPPRTPATAPGSRSVSTRVLCREPCAGAAGLQLPAAAAEAAQTCPASMHTHAPLLPAPCCRVVVPGVFPVRGGGARRGSRHRHL